MVLYEAFASLWVIIKISFFINFKTPLVLLAWYNNFFITMEKKNGKERSKFNT
ncbi:hypothetical protein BSPWISOXPB_9476 [uncultured Gammaproteobacteria bacterium]|nr:hypothetical protein BSPWISOXPB_9476 [uncultured Gammaproteobacteria bacterium]